MGLEMAQSVKAYFLHIFQNAYFENESWSKYQSLTSEVTGDSFHERNTLTDVAAGQRSEVIILHKHAKNIKSELMLS